MHVGGQIVETSDDSKNHNARKTCRRYRDVAGKRPGRNEQTEHRHQPENEHLEQTSHLHQAGECATALQSKDGSRHSERGKPQRKKNARGRVGDGCASASRENDSEADEEVHEHSSEVLHRCLWVHVFSYL